MPVAVKINHGGRLEMLTTLNVICLFVLQNTINLYPTTLNVVLFYE